MSSDQIANSTVPQGSSEAWTDKKRYLWLIGLVVPSLAFAGYGLWLAHRYRRPGSGSGRSCSW